MLNKLTSFGKIILFLFEFLLKCSEVSASNFKHHYTVKPIEFKMIKNLCFSSQHEKHVGIITPLTLTSCQITEFM